MYLHSSSPHPRQNLGGTQEGFQSNILKPCQQLFTFPSVRYKSGIKHIIYYTINIYILYKNQCVRCTCILCKVYTYIYTCVYTPYKYYTSRTVRTRKQTCIQAKIKKKNKKLSKKYLLLFAGYTWLPVYMVAFGIVYNRMGVISVHGSKYHITIPMLFIFLVGTHFLRLKHLYNSCDVVYLTYVATSI